MKHTRARLVGFGCVGILSTSLLGCAIVADTLNPGLLSQFGLDPNVLFPSQGSVIVQVENNTQVPAVFNLYQTVDPQDLSTGSRSFALAAAPGESRNEVLDCPIGELSPGEITGATNALARDFANAVVAGGTAVPYAGQPLVSADGDFRCGSVIVVTLEQVGGGTDTMANVFITVQVLPGR